jgi:hypothetical protein
MKKLTQNILFGMSPLDVAKLSAMGAKAKRTISDVPIPPIPLIPRFLPVSSLPAKQQEFIEMMRAKDEAKLAELRHRIAMTPGERKEAHRVKIGRRVAKQMEWQARKFPLQGGAPGLVQQK